VRSLNASGHLSNKYAPQESRADEPIASELSRASPLEFQGGSKFPCASAHGRHCEVLGKALVCRRYQPLARRTPSPLRSDIRHGLSIPADVTQTFLTHPNSSAIKLERPPQLDLGSKAVRYTLTFAVKATRYILNESLRRKRRPPIVVGESGNLRAEPT
jgi:hypothetical protein